MKPPARAPRAAGRRGPSPLPKAITNRTDRLVEVSDHCAVAKSVAEALGEDFLAYLLAMVIHETAATMRRTTAGAPSPKKVRKRSTVLS